MEKKKKRSTKRKLSVQLSPMQAEMEMAVPSRSAAENKATLDRIFKRLYKLHGSDLTGLADEIEPDEEESNKEQGEHLFHVHFRKYVPDQESDGEL